MFGYVTASTGELTDRQRTRWGSIYCGICRCIGKRHGQLARLVLRYDCAFLALLLMSLYEPREQAHQGRCPAHPLSKKPWVDSEYIRYAADMNVALAYYKADDDWRDDGSLSAKALKSALKPRLSIIEEAYPRQCGAIARCIRELSQLEKENCSQIETCAGCFGALMGELLVYREDLWADTLRSMGQGLGRFIYLADGAQDLSRDEKKGRYNPWLATGCRDKGQWRQYLVLEMSTCAEHYERLPLVQDKDILDNIIYSGVWTRIEKEDGHG